MLPSPSFEDVVKSAGYLNAISHKKVRITMKFSAEKMTPNTTAAQFNVMQKLVFLKNRIITVGSTSY